MIQFGLILKKLRSSGNILTVFWKIIIPPASSNLYLVFGTEFWLWESFDCVVVFLYQKPDLVKITSDCSSWRL